MLKDKTESCKTITNHPLVSQSGLGSGISPIFGSLLWWFLDYFPPGIFFVIWIFGKFSADPLGILTPLSSPTWKHFSSLKISNPGASLAGYLISPFPDQRIFWRETRLERCGQCCFFFSYNQYTFIYLFMMDLQFLSSYEKFW